MDCYDTASRRIAMSHVLDAQALAIDISAACATLHRESVDALYESSLDTARVRALVQRAARLHAALNVVLAHCEEEESAECSDRARGAELVVR